MATNGYKKIPNDDHTEKVSFVSVLLFQWMNSVFKTGSERALDEKDFLPLSDEDTTSSVTERLQTKWNDEITNSKGKENNFRLRLRWQYHGRNFHCMSCSHADCY